MGPRPLMLVMSVQALLPIISGLVYRIAPRTAYICIYCHQDLNPNSPHSCTVPMNERDLRKSSGIDSTSKAARCLTPRGKIWRKSD